MKDKTHTLKSSKDLKLFAAHFIKEKMLQPRDRALVVSLVGNLGAGKTTFVQGVARFLGIVRPMPSPTFTIMREVVLNGEVNGIATIYHFDWFRLKSEKDVTALGWNDIIQNPKNLVLVEWGDKFPTLFLRGTCQINLFHKGINRGLTQSTL